jgi:hypothetical protein
MDFKSFSREIHRLDEQYVWLDGTSVANSGACEADKFLLCTRVDSGTSAVDICLTDVARAWVARLDFDAFKGHLREIGVNASNWEV